MLSPALRRAAACLALLAWTSCADAKPLQARLVHCGQDTCLRLAGHRAGAAVAIRVAGQDLAVEGGRSWHATVPLGVARGWLPRNDEVGLSYFDPNTEAEQTATLALPPGALGSGVTLVSLVVAAR